jgi:hypothetical protein
MVKPAASRSPQTEPASLRCPVRDGRRLEASRMPRPVSCPVEGATLDSPRPDCVVRRPGAGPSSGAKASPK